MGVDPQVALAPGSARSRAVFTGEGLPLTPTLSRGGERGQSDPATGVTRLPAIIPPPSTIVPGKPPVIPGGWRLAAAACAPAPRPSRAMGRRGGLSASNLVQMARLLFVIPNGGEAGVEGSAPQEVCANHPFRLGRSSHGPGAPGADQGEEIDGEVASVGAKSVCVGHQFAR